MSTGKAQNDYLKESELREYVQRAQEFIENNPNSNEPDTKNILVDPLIDLLGWDKFRNEVKVEYKVDFGSRSGTYNVDYALLLEDVPVVFIETKRLGADITSHSKQAIKYGKAEDIKWVVATNGKRIEIFNTEKGKDRDSCLLKSIPLEKYLEEKDTLGLLSKKAISEDKLEEFDKKIRSKRKAIKNLKNSQKEVEEEISELIKDKVDEPIYDKIEGLTPTLVDDLIKRIEGKKDIDEKETTKPQPSDEVDIKDDVIEIDPEDTDNLSDDLSYVKFIQGEVGNENITGYWKDLLGFLIDKAITEQGMELRKLRRLIQVNIVEGKKTDTGYKYLSDADVSFQGKSASDTWEESLKILKELNESAKVEFQWRPKEEASYPGERGIIKWP